MRGTERLPLLRWVRHHMIFGAGSCCAQVLGSTQEPCRGNGILAWWFELYMHWKETELNWPKRSLQPSEVVLDTSPRIHTLLLS